MYCLEFLVLYVICLLTKYYCDDPAFSATAKAETVPRIRGSNWPHEKNMNALMLPEGEYMNLQVCDGDINTKHLD